MIPTRKYSVLQTELWYRPRRAPVARDVTLRYLFNSNLEHGAFSLLTKYLDKGMSQHQAKQ